MIQACRGASREVGAQRLVLVTSFLVFHDWLSKKCLDGSESTEVCVLPLRLKLLTIVTVGSHSYYFNLQSARFFFFLSLNVDITGSNGGRPQAVQLTQSFISILIHSPHPVSLK